VTRVTILTTRVIIINIARVKCNRCGINKSPKKHVKKPKKPERPELVLDDDKRKKPFQERVGDWVCIKCKNLNFSFRVICNRCQLPKVESEKMFDQYMSNLMNYVKFNEVMQKQLVVGQGGSNGGNGGNVGIHGSHGNVGIHGRDLGNLGRDLGGSNTSAKQGLINNNSININNNFYGNYPKNEYGNYYRQQFNDEGYEK
jgi:hypothetical protein